MKQSETPYADALRKYANSNVLRLNTPGHQISESAQPALLKYFGKDLLNLDVQPNVDGIDFGVDGGPLNNSLQLAAEAWGAHRTWFLTNGASMGNLMACLTLANLGTNLAVQRSVHSSVIDGMALGGLDPTFVYPSVDSDLGIANGITPDALSTALQSLENPTAAYVVTPSYFGAVADVAALAEVAHSFGVPLIVDEAWGAHFGFHPELPTNAIRLGADIVISSTHKLGGSFTQTAMLHLGKTQFTEILEPLLDRSFQSLQSTSASSILLASLDLARHSLATLGKTSVTASIAAFDQIRAGIAKAGRFVDVAATLLQYPDVMTTDPLRISMNTVIGGIPGHQARSILLTKHNIHCEMANATTVVMLIGAGVVPDVQQVLRALNELPTTNSVSAALKLPEPGARAMSVRSAYFSKTEIVSASAAISRVSADSVAAYPPGIPNLLPGEVITGETVEFLQATMAQPFGHVRGSVNSELSAFRVVAD